MTRGEVRFRFKGSRTYVQGPDLYERLLDNCGDGRNVTDIQFSMHGFIETPAGELVMTTDEAEFETLGEAPVQCRLSIDGQRRWVKLFPRADPPAVAERYDYDETLIIRQCRKEENSIRLAGTSPCSFIETVVAMNKQLLTLLFPDKPGQWVFSRIDLPRRVEYRDGLELSLVHNFNFRLLRSVIRHGGEECGSLYFTLKMP